MKYMTKVISSGYYFLSFNIYLTGTNILKNFITANASTRHWIAFI